ncbi:sunset domain-containing protein [Pseudomonas taeanensis]
MGNRNSRVYHLPKGCPSYNQVGERNQVAFNSAAEAEAAGVRQAGNCR